MSGVITRFAPSPTGMLHIGGARTALFNALYASHTGGRFLLRIEDTDRERSTPEAAEAIFTGLKALGLVWHGEPVYQSQNVSRHRQAVDRLLKSGQAYKAYDTPEEIEELRQASRTSGQRPVYRTQPRPDDRYVIRFRMPEADVTIDDQVQGQVRVPRQDLDDWVMERADGTPTYMLAAVVDDIDAGVTHIIRGDDHLLNAARQQPVFAALGAPLPVYAHIPLIHGADGQKLSKRHGAAGVADYQAQGYLPEALVNYLSMLGWAGPGGDIFTFNEAAAAFDLKALVRSPARLDEAKLRHINAHYLRAAVADDQVLSAFAQRVQTRLELDEATAFIKAPVVPDEAAARALSDSDVRERLRRLVFALTRAERAEDYDAQVREFLKLEGVGMPALAPNVRAALTGRTSAPGLGLIISAVGYDEARKRLLSAAEGQ